MSSEETAAGVDVPEVEMETVGVDEMVRQERVRSIFQAKADCREARTKASNEAAIGDSNAGAIIYRNALETYIREVEPLFSQTDKGRRYWSDHHFGTIDVRPRHENVDETNRATGVIENATPVDDEQREKIDLVGLRSLFDAPTPLRVPFELFVKQKFRGGGLKCHETVSERNIPIQTLDKMYAVTNGYLAEIGFGVEVGKAEQHTKLDDDLLDEVEAWRRENL
jgi:hypothetical protein